MSRAALAVKVTTRQSLDVNQKETAQTYLSNKGIVPGKVTRDERVGLFNHIRDAYPNRPPTAYAVKKFLRELT